MNELFPNVSWTNFLIIPGMLIAFTVHELGHATVAYFLGDNSQVEQGNITLNPFKHLSVFGAIAFILTGYFGWAKALQVDPHKLNRRYFDLFLVAMSGPIASLTFSLLGLLIILTTVAMLIYFQNSTTDYVLSLFFPLATNPPKTFDWQAISLAFTGYVFIASFCLTVTSLIPLPGFDGFTAIASLIVFFRERQQHKIASAMSASPNSGSSAQIIRQKKHRNKVSGIHFNLGTEYHDQGQYNDAIARYRQALNSDKHFGPAYINMGLAYLAKGKRNEAMHAFRGAIQLADDQKSRDTAWQQLHKLSEVSPTDTKQANQSMSEMGAEPWTDTQPRPNWFGLTIGLVIFVVLGLAIYGYIVMQLINQF
ncbi:tetratricopeptide repeat protein [Anaerolineales bacterium HSG24]|nr:tetratricopeptide repeat protein [Anaerolineales bacterium HSG24]